MNPSKIKMNEAHPSYLGWQVDWPLFVKAPMLTMQGKVFSRGDYFPWSEMQAAPDKIAILYAQGKVHHNAPAAAESGKGDRLGELTIEPLHTIVNLLNTKLKKDHTATDTQYKQKRCRKSTIVDTQRRYIRQFLSKNPFMSDYFLEIREPLLSKGD